MFQEIPPFRAQTDAGQRRGWSAGAPAPETIFSGFAFVMATGIVSIATGLVGFGKVSAALFGLNLIAYPAVWALLLLSLVGAPGSLRRALRDGSVGPRQLTLVAGTCVLGNEIALTGTHHTVAVGFLFAAAMLWLGLIYGFFARTSISAAKPGLAAGIDGSWLLVVVATEALAILTTRAGAGPNPPDIALFFSLCLFLLGSTFYVLLLGLIVYRLLFFPISAEQLTPGYWINMGAAAITTLAGARLMETIGSDAALTSLRSLVFAATLLFWSVATWWIPLLAGLMLWRHGAGRVGLGYRQQNWAMVFPLGMYTAATWRLSHVGGLAFLAGVPAIFVWVALMAWCLTFAGMMRALARWPLRAVGKT